MVSGKSMMAPPLVSVVIPAYQAARWIAETLDSVLAQTFHDYEIIVVNDGSPDTVDLERALEPYRKRIVYLRQENRGPAGARNTAIRAARGRYIAPLDADDQWEPEFLAEQVAILEADSSLDLVYAGVRVFGDAPDAGRAKFASSEGEVTFARLVLEEFTVAHCATVARREALVRVGLFDESFGHAEDFELWLRLAKFGGRIGYQRRVLSRYRRRAGSLNSDDERMGGSVLRALAKAEQYPDITPAERECIEQRRRVEKARLDLIAGKKAVAAGDAEAAMRHLARANASFQSRKLSATILLLRFAPHLVRTIYRWRNRYIFGRATGP